MKIGILVSMMNNFGEKGFYNSQEIGMGKELAQYGNEVIIYKCIKSDYELPEDSKENNLEIRYKRVKSIGINGMVDTLFLDSDLDGLIFFADTQISAPIVYKWCKKHNIVFLPYIGVIESHSTNRIVRLVMNTLFYRNIKVYKKCSCLVKNTDVLNRLEKRGIRNITFAPVGIDLDLLNHDFEKTNVNDLKKKYGYCEDDKVIVFIGRLEEEKRPIELISYFAKIYEKCDRYKLLIVGKGSLYQNMKEEISKKNFSSNTVQYIEKIPNDQIWELYRISDCFVNLNKQEIFGMVLLEAMYYKTKIIAWHAPGPDFIIENGKSGYLVNSESEFYECLGHEDDNVKSNAHERVVNHLTWENTSRIIIDKIRSK